MANLMNGFSRSMPTTCYGNTYVPSVADEEYSDMLNDYDEEVSTITPNGNTSCDLTRSSYVPHHQCLRPTSNYVK